MIALCKKILIIIWFEIFIASDGSIHIGIIFELSVFRVWGNITAVNCVSNPPLDHKIESRTREWVFLLHKYLLTTIIIITSAEFYACQLQFS